MLTREFVGESGELRVGEVLMLTFKAVSVAFAFLSGWLVIALGIGIVLGKAIAIHQREPQEEAESRAAA
jgi:hypothetical protein